MINRFLFAFNVLAFALNTTLFAIDTSRWWAALVAMLNLVAAVMIYLANRSLQRARAEAFEGFLERHGS